MIDCLTYWEKNNSDEVQMTRNGSRMREERKGNIR